MEGLLLPQAPPKPGQEGGGGGVGAVGTGRHWAVESPQSWKVCLNPSEVGPGACTLLSDFKNPFY